MLPGRRADRQRLPLAGAVEEASEWLVLVKTTVARYEALEARLRELHPYDEPEIVGLPFVRGSVGYLGWVLDSVTVS